ncbi:MAG: RNB domain-containing ribonuclease, partial [Crocinitomicaceae bacterium]|nr:RNB domain-containing ribonuclease [Crocinitomicaceae bacterium]
MSKRRKNSGGNLKKTLQRGIQRIFEQNPETTYNYKQISSILDVKDAGTRKLINEILEELAWAEHIKAVQRGQYKLKGGSRDLIGRISFTQRGAAYVIIENVDDDVYIHQSKTGKAFNNDIVKIKTFKHKGKTEGEVLEVVERVKTEFVGTIEKNQNTCFVRPDDKNMPVDFFIERGHEKGAKNGQKVVVKLLSWPTKAPSPLGGIVDVLGDAGDKDVAMHSILAEFGLPYKFPPEVLKDSETIANKDYTDVSGRRDMRKVLTFTIDPHDAKDFDDALSYQVLENGNIEVGIHIADVANFVRPGSAIDKEAYTRGNSVYLVDRVVPMLPEILSNKLCSLRPNEEKMTFSAVFELDAQAKIVNEWFGKTVIYSDQRFAYEDAQVIIESDSEALSKEENKNFIEPILTLDKYAKILRKKRLNVGALNIESTEVRFKLDEKGHPIGLMLKVSKDANKLIEEFMLLAN